MTIISETIVVKGVFPAGNIQFSKLEVLNFFKYLIKNPYLIHVNIYNIQVRNAGLFLNATKLSLNLL